MIFVSIADSQLTCEEPAEHGRDVLLRVEHTSRRFGEIVALDDVTFDVYSGEVYGIAGPNGAGKSTLFNVIAGLTSAKGHREFSGHDITTLRPHQICKKGLARTFQVTMLCSTKTVEENVGIGAFFGRAGRGGRTADVVLEAMDIVGITHRRKVAIQHLNLFEEKLTALAAVLATKPSLVLLDEPLGGLAPSEAAVLAELVLRLRSEFGITFVVIEHHVRRLVDLSDRLMVLVQGQRIAEGQPELVLNDPQVLDIYLGKDADV